VIQKINSQTLGMPPTWMERAVSRGGAMANSQEIKKLLGEPIPVPVDLNTLPPELAQMFAANGVLERIRSKLAQITRHKNKKKKKGGKFIPSRGTIASVDEDDNIYIGIDFLMASGEDEALLAGILAHEWGHMVSDLPKGKNWSHLTWDQLYEIRRDEEGEADAFAGRALSMMGYSTTSMTNFLKKLSEKKVKGKLPSRKYYNTATRIAIIEEAFKIGERTLDAAKKVFTNKDGTGAKIGKVFGES